jgi:hypothetical protein
MSTLAYPPCDRRPTSYMDSWEWYKDECEGYNPDEDENDVLRCW